MTTLNRRLFLAACAAAAAPVLLPGRARAAGQSIQIGMVQGMFRDVQPAMVQAMARPLRSLIRQQTGLEGEVDIVPDARTLADKMRDGRFQLGVFHGFEFAWVRLDSPDLIPLVVTVPPARMLRAVVVVSKFSEAKRLADLKGESILVPRGTKAHCYLYLEARRQGLADDCAALKTKPAVTSEEALDKIVQGEAAAAVVDASALLGYQKLQPGAYGNLKVLCQSEPFPPTVIAAQRGSLPEATMASVQQLLTTAHQTPAGRPLMMMWNLKGFEPVPPDYGTQLDAVAKAYPTPAPGQFPGAVRATTLGQGGK